MIWFKNLTFKSKMRRRIAAVSIYLGTKQHDGFRILNYLLTMSAFQVLVDVSSQKRQQKIEKQLRNCSTIPQSFMRFSSIFDNFFQKVKLNFPGSSSCWTLLTTAFIQLILFIIWLKTWKYEQVQQDGKKSWVILLSVRLRRNENIICCNASISRSY